MTDKKNREDKQGENAQQHYNNQALLAAFPFTAQNGYQFQSEQFGDDESQVKMFQEGMHHTHEQALDSYREGTVDAFSNYKRH